MEMKNDCERDYIKEAFDKLDYIKEAFDKLYNCVISYIDLKQLDDADTAFKELDKKVHSEIYILKKRLAESDRAVDAGLTRSEVDRERINDLEEQLAQENQRLKLLENSRTGWRSRAQHAEERVMDLNKRINELEEENANLRVTVTPFDTLEALKKENSELRAHNENLVATCKSRLKALFEAKIEAAQYKKSFMEHYEENDRLRGVIDEKEKEINSLKKTIHELEEENAGDANRIEALENVNSALKKRHEILYSKIEELKIGKRPWHGDGNAMTGGRTCCESLADAIEFQNKKQENVDLSYGHEFEFGDEVFVPWSDGPYMYVKSGLMYNPRTERLVYVGKTQHLKWFGEKFSIV